MSDVQWLDYKTATNPQSVVDYIAERLGLDPLWLAHATICDQCCLVDGFDGIWPDKCLDWQLARHEVTFGPHHAPTAVDELFQAMYDAQIARALKATVATDYPLIRFEKEQA